MKMPQVALSLDCCVIELLKKSSKKNKISLSENLRQKVLEGLLKEYPDLVAFRHPITGKITEVLNKEDSIRFREKIQEADNDIAEGRIYSLKNIDDNFWQEINSGD